METCKNFKALFKNQLHSSPMFLKILNEDFSSYLIISKENLGKAQQAFANREVITLIGPNGKYDIGTKMSREGVILEKGWAEFSRAHHLCNTDKLIFACGCHGLFFALIFDKNGKLVGRRFGPSEAEEDGIILEHDNINDKEAQSQGKKEKVVASSSRLPGKRKGTSNQCEPPPARPKLISISSDSSINNDAGKEQASGAKKPCEKREISDTSDSSDSETNGPQIIAKLRKTFVSGRRPVTDVEVEKILRAAQGFQSSRPYFLKQMKSNNVYREFSFIVPIKFARANLPDHATQISLRVPGKTDEWEVNCKVRVQNAGTQLVWIIMGGWSKFSLANNLEEGDTLVFEMTKKDLTKKKNPKIKMDVHIFRVVKEIKPLKVL